MYLPKHFDPKSMEAVAELIRENPFSILINGSQISHLPLSLERRDSQLVLHGHMARANPHWQSFGQEALVIVQGPHAYISSSWYAEHDVPTWNYVVAHLRGKAVEVPVLPVLKRVAEDMEPGSFFVPEDLIGKLDKALVGFEIRVESIEAKFKLSQNRSERDVSQVIEALSAKSDSQSQALSQWMRRYTLPRA